MFGLRDQSLSVTNVKREPYSIIIDQQAVFLSGGNIKVGP